MRKVLLITGLFILSALSYAQKPVQKEILDTIRYNRNTFILFKDNTWQLIGVDSTFSENIPEMVDEENADTTDIYSTHWINDQVFAYLGIKNKLTHDTSIRLAGKHSIFTLPVYGRLFRGFSYYHKGLDIGLKKGDPVFAAFDGVVRYARYNSGGFGYLVILRHSNGLETYYAHLSRIKVSVNQQVSSGDLIGFGGSTGRSRSPHLHFEVRFKDIPLDPLKMIDFDNQRLYSNTLEINKSVFTPTENLTGAKYYRIRKGDTLGRIAGKYGTSVSMLCAWNKIRKSTALRVGRSLRVR